MEIFLIIIIVVWFCFYHIYKEKQLKFVLEHSVCLKAIKALNNKWRFKEFDNNQRFKRSCNSKSQFDRFNIHNHMLLTMEAGSEFFESITKAVDYNRGKYSQYEQQYNQTLQMYLSKTNYNKLIGNFKIKVDTFKKIEREECEKLKKFAPLDFNIELLVTYTSPQGRNRYCQSYNFNYDNIKCYLKELALLQQNKQSAVYIRSQMTQKLRYQILRRDNFACVICGRTQSDGAKLHVDHIKPVAKGGTNDESNLRTLCDMCNFGKSDFYDPNGVN